MTLDEIMKKHGIDLRDARGDIRNAVDILEDMFLKLSTSDYVKLMFEIAEEEKNYNLFTDARNRKYRGAE